MTANGKPKRIIRSTHDALAEHQQELREELARKHNLEPVPICNDCHTQLMQFKQRNDDGTPKIVLLCPKCLHDAPKKIDQCEPRERPGD